MSITKHRGRHRQYRRPRTRLGRLITRLFGDGLIWLWTAMIIIGAALYLSIPGGPA